ncbi:MAG: DUF2304 domain-containing protein [Bryobacteraceae bacterium]|nr:DUF2304 domain-containing protein [Bryobacteraceae bacterium]
MERLLNVLTVFSVVLLILVLRSVRKAHIRVEYSVSWLGAALTLLALSQMEGFLGRLGQFLGVANPPLALAFITGGIFLIVFYRHSVVLSELKDANISLAQRVAILEFHLRTLHEEQKAKSGA